DEDRDPGICPDSYYLTRTWTATDDCGNDVEHVQVVTVVDTTPPRFVGDLPGDTTAECDDVPDPATLTATDNCDDDVPVRFNEGRNSGDCPANYVLIRTWTAADDCGNQIQHVQRVTVDDTTDPVITSCPGDEDVQCRDDVPNPDPGAVVAHDNCDSDLYVYWDGDQSDGNTCPEIITRTYVAEDDCGNSASCTQEIRVYDTIPPMISCPADGRAECDEEPDFGWPTTSDNCDADLDITWNDVTQPGSSPSEYAIVRTWTAEDDCHNTASCAQRMEVADDTPPTIVCPGPVRFSCDDQAEFGWPTVSDDCDDDPDVTWVDRTVPGSCANAYQVVRTWTATDAAGNAASCNQTMTIYDGTPPDITCPGPRTFECNQQIDFGMATATDNCDDVVAITFVDNQIPGGSPQEYVIERTWRATDDCGNVASCVERVSVVDTHAPTLTGAADERLLCAQPVVFTEPTATDSCDAAPTIRIASDTRTAGPEDCEYTYTRCWEAVDAAGNVSGRVCQSIIRFEDAAAPQVVFCPADTVIDSGDPVVFGEPIFSDNCLIPGQDFPVDSDLSSSVAEGETTYTTCWTTVDLCGNISEECCQSITVAAPPDTAPYCTFVCWNWTAACLKDAYNREISTPPACLRDDHFADVFPNGAVIGTHTSPGRYTATWTSPGAVERFKCGYGIPEPLTRDWVDPRNTDLGVLQAEILTLRLNREFSCAGYFEAYGYPLGEGCFGNFVVPPECLKFAGLTVDQFLAVADRAVAGDKSSLLPYGYSYFRLWSTAQYLNALYGQCNGYGGQVAAMPPLDDAGDEMVADEAPEESAEALPAVFSMTGQPNPLRGSVTISLALPAEGDVSLDVYDIQGRVVRTLIREHRAAGYHSVTWNGTDSYGSQVVAGVYFCRVQVNGRVMAMEKLMKL
ncbi:MAG: FlgD immunoglobulin-like domain containing protein, partial [bacterium]